MPFIDTRELAVHEPLPGWKGRYFHSENMTFGWYVVSAGSSIHEHAHPNEEVWHVIEGELEATIDGVTKRAGAGCAVLVPAHATHSVRARSDARALVVDHPVRRELPGRGGRPR